MGVIDRQSVVGQSIEEDKLYTFSSKPSTPGEKSPDILVRFQAVSRTQPCIAHQYCKLNSGTRLSSVRQYINQFFKNYFSDGFIFLSKTKEILRSNERSLTLFDILPKVPSIYNKKKEKEVPNDAFTYPDVQYKKVGYEFEGRQYSIMCACVIFLYEASKVSHWPPEVLHEDLSANTIEGFCFIPTDIMSWKDKIIESRASSLHLHAACGAKKELELTMHQLPGKININHLRDQRGACPLHYAAENGHIDACELLVTGIGKDLIYQRDLNDKTPLHCALYRRKAKTITYLLQLNSDLFFKDSYGNSCLDLLLKQNDKDLEFIIYKLQIECIDDLLKFQLAWCTINKGNRPLSRYLVKHLSRFDFDPLLGQSILHIAVKMKDKDVIDTLISNGVNLQSRDIRGFLPFHVGCRYGYMNIQTLFYGEIDDSDLCRGIQLALRNRNFSICSAIIQLKHDIFIDEQTTCLVLDALDSELRKVHNDKYFEKDLKIWESIAKHLLPLVAKDKVTLNSYVFDCAFYGASETLALLSSLGAELDLRDQMGRTPLHEASQKNRIQVLEYLIAAGVDPNKTDWRGSTPLHYACARNNLQAVTTLMTLPVINAGAQDNCGRTPLLVSVYHKRHDIVHYLIRKHVHRINLHATDIYGHSILHYTIHMNESCVELLLASFSSVEKSESKLRRGLRRWRDTSDHRAWLRKLMVTEFKLHHTLPVSESSNTKDLKAIVPFSYKKEIVARDTSELLPENQTKQWKRPVTKCVKCDKYLAHKKKKNTRFSGKHICERNCVKTKPGDDGRRRMKVKPFSYHSFDFSDQVTPLLQAIRANQNNLVKRLNRFDHSYKDKLDAQNRTLLEFAVDQNSVIMLKTVFDMKPVVQPGLMHRVLLQKVRNRKDTTRKHMVEFLLSKGYSSEEIPESTEITHDIGACAWRSDDRNPKCSRDCHLKAYTVLEISVRNNEEDIFKLLLENTVNFQHNFLLNLLASNGSVWMIESFLKRRTKIKTLKEKDNDIDKLDDLEICHVLDIACCSKKLSTVLIQSLVKVTPDIFANACVTDPDEYSVHSRPEVDWNMMYEMTTLGKLMSKDHPLAKLKSKDGREKVENTACFLIDSGIQLDDLVNDFDRRLHVHGVCEAFMCSMENGYYRAAVSLLEEAGDVFWDCAMNINRCKVQINFNQTKYQKFSRLPDQERIRENATRYKHSKKDFSPFHFSISEAEQFERFHDVKRDFLKYHLLLACEESIPDTVLRELLRAGREFFDTVDYPVPDINLDEIHDNRFDEVCEIDSPLVRLLLCVCELMSAYSLFRKRYDVLRLLKLAPVLYPYLHLVDRNIFFEPINRGRGSLILQRCVNLAYRKLENRKLKKLNMSDGTTLLHLVCSGDSVDIVKSILKAETHIDIDSIAENGLRPIDVAVACGSWNVYKLLCDSGALVTGQTLVACCATEKFLGIETWANHIRGYRYSDRGIEKSRVKIVKDICERNDIDVSFDHPDHGSAVENAVKFKYWEIIEFFNKKRWSMMKSSLQKDGNVASMLFRDGPDKLLTKILQNLEKNITSVSRTALQQIILQSANRKSVLILNAVVNIICEKHPHHSWSDLLNVKDKHGMGALHYASSRGFYSPVKIWAEKMGNMYYKDSCKLDAYDSYTRTDSPVYFALANKHWDIALCLLFNGSQPSFKRSVPDFYIKGRFSVSNSQGKSEPACLSDKHFWTSDKREKSLLRIPWKEKRLFPQQVNRSENILLCISPDLKENIKQDDVKFVTTASHRITERVLITNPNTEKKAYVKRVLTLVKIASHNKCSLIHVACAVGDTALVQELLKSHPNVTEAEDMDGVLPYIYAIAGGNKEVIELMKTDLIQRNVEEAIKVLIWKCVIKDVENAKHPILNDNFKQVSTNSRVYVDKRKFKIMFRFLSAFEVDELDSHTEDDISQEYGNLVLLETLQNIRDKICTYSIRHGWNSASLARSDGKSPDLFDEEYLLQVFEYVLGEVDPRKLDAKLLLSLVAIGRPKVLDTLLKAWKHREETFHTLENPLVGNFSILDCIIICIESHTEQSKSFLYYLDQYRAIVEELISTADILLHPEVAQIAVKKKLWALFEPVAKKAFQNKAVELGSYWLEILAVSVEDGQLSFFRTILDLVGFPKMAEEDKQKFVPFLYLACLHGKLDIVKYLLRYNIPISSTTDHMAMLDILGCHYQGSWTVLHYAIKSGCADVIKIILRSCKHDTLYLQSISLGDIFRLAVGLKDNTIFKILEDYFEEVNGSKLTLTELERLLLFSARKGYSHICKQLLVTKELSIFTADSDNKNTMHFAAIYDMKNVAELVMKTTPDIIRLKDTYGLTPIDYAYALGNIDMIGILSSNTDLSVRPNDAFHDIFGWLRGLLEANSKVIDNSISSVCRPVVPVDKGLCLEGMLLRSDDNAASFFINCSRHFLAKCIHDNVNNYGKLFHQAARYGCSKSICSLFEIVDADTLTKILCMDHANLTPIAWAVKMSNVRVIEIITAFDKEKLSSSWKAPFTEENLLHIAVKTGKLEIVRLIDIWTERLLRSTQDKHGVTPGVCAVALGFQHLLPSLYDDTISDEYHNSNHINETTDFTCVECLLDQGIGWSKNLQQHLFNKDDSTHMAIARPITAIVSTRGMADTRSFQFQAITLWIDDEKWKKEWKKWLNGKPNERSFFEYLRTTRRVHKIISVLDWCRFRTDHNMVASLMRSMGYRTDEISVLTILNSLEEQYSKTCPPLKLLRLRLRANPYLGKCDISSETEMALFEVAAASGNKKFFESNTKRFNLLSGKINEKFLSSNDNLSLCEIAYGFGHSELGKFLEDELTRFGLHGIYRSLQSLRSILPQKVLWSLKLELPGDESWKIEEEIQKRENRLTKSDIWLTTSYPTNVLQEIEQDIVPESIIPPKCANKKFNPDVDGFAKQTCFSGKSDIWFRCLMASSIIYGHTYDVLHMDESRFTTVSSLRILCIPADTADHAKTVIEQNGTYIESVGLHTSHGSVSVQNDNTQYQRVTEAKIRDTIHHKVIPEIQQQIQETFGIKVNIKIDWRTVDSQKRTSGSDTILRLLSNEAGNSLAGLEDTLRHCKEMKNDINYMFNEATVKHAIAPVSSIREVIIKYVDTLPDFETVFQRKFTQSQTTCFWHFSIERSTLKYDRSTFRLWHYMQLYHGTCLSLLEPVYRIVSIDTGAVLKNKKKKKKTQFKPITLEIDWNSFGVTEPYTMHALITQKVAREVIAIVQHCEAMFHLKLSGDHVIIQNSTSSKYTGVTPIFKLLTINVYAHQLKNKAWEVSSENTFTKLCELEDKELLSTFPSSMMQRANKRLCKMQEKIVSETGIPARVFIDEKRLLSLTFNKFRRDMVHPKSLIARSIRDLLSCVPNIYSRVLSFILQSPASTFCKMVSRFHLPSGIWTDNRILQKTKTLCLLALCDDNQNVNMVGKYPDSKRKLHFRTISSERLCKTSGSIVLGPWALHPLSFCFENVRSMDHQTIKYISFDNTLYKVLDVVAMIEVFSNIQTKFVLHDLLFEHLENITDVRLTDKIFQSPVHSLTEICPRPSIITLSHYLKQQPKLKHFLPQTITDQVMIDWRSFYAVDKQDHKGDCLLMDVVYSFVNSYCRFAERFNLFQGKQSLCRMQESNRILICETLRGLTFTIQKTSDKMNAADGVKIGHQKGNPEIHLLTANDVHFIFSDSAVQTDYSDNLQSIIIRILESELKSYLSGSFARDEETPSLKLQQIQNFLAVSPSVLKSRPPLEVILQAHRQLRKALDEIFKTHNGTRLNFLQNLDEVCYINSHTSKTILKYVDDTLKIQISSRDISEYNFVRELYKIPDLRVQMEQLSNGKISFLTTGYSSYFVCKSRNTILLKAVDSFRNTPDRFLIDAHTDKETFKILLHKGSLKHIEEDVSDKGQTKDISTDILSESFGVESPRTKLKTTTTSPESQISKDIKPGIDLLQKSETHVKFDKLALAETVTGFSNVSALLDNEMKSRNEKTQEVATELRENNESNKSTYQNEESSQLEVKMESSDTASEMESTKTNEMERTLTAVDMKPLHSEGEIESSRTENVTGTGTSLEKVDIKSQTIEMETFQAESDNDSFNVTVEMEVSQAAGEMESSNTAAVTDSPRIEREMKPSKTIGDDASKTSFAEVEGEIISSEATDQIESSERGNTEFEDAASNVNEILHSIIDQIEKEKSETRSPNMKIEPEIASEIETLETTGKIGSCQTDQFNVEEATYDVKEILYNIIDQIGNEGSEIESEVIELSDELNTSDPCEEVSDKTEMDVNKKLESDTREKLSEEKDETVQSKDIATINLISDQSDLTNSPDLLETTETVGSEMEKMQQKYDTITNSKDSVRVESLDVFVTSVENQDKLSQPEIEQNPTITEPNRVLGEHGDETDIALHRICEPDEEKTEITPDKVRMHNDCIEITWDASNLDFKGLTRIELEHYGRKLDIPKTIHFYDGPELYKNASYLGAVHGVKIDRDGFVALLLEHDQCSHIKSSADELDPITELCKQKHMPFISPVFKSEDDQGVQVQFHIFTSPKRYGKGKLLPIKLEPLTVLQENGSWKWNFLVHSVDPARQARLRVTCKFCKHYLKIATPLCVIGPGNELVINSFSE